MLMVLRRIYTQFRQLLWRRLTLSVPAHDIVKFLNHGFHPGMGFGRRLTGVVVFFKKHVGQPVISCAGTVSEVEQSFQIDDSFATDN